MTARIDSGSWALTTRSARYLQSYVNEYTLRYNHREDAEPMYKVLGGRVSKTRHGRYGQYAPVGE